MKRGAVVAFGALIAATIAAFFVTQHLKVSTPLVAGFPHPDPGAINPYGARCGAEDHSRMRISFYLLHRSDDVDVYMVDQNGTIVRTLAIGRHMRRGVRHPDGDFSWNGREDNGAVAPDGKYYVRVALLGQGRTVQLDKPVTVLTNGPHPSVRSVTPSLLPQGTTPAHIRYRGNENHDPTVMLYRTDLPGRPRLVDQFAVSRRSPAQWNGQVQGHPAAAGTYLVGLEVSDVACNIGRFPPVLPPPAGSTTGAGVTIRYLAAQPPLDPVAAGERATVNVDARGHTFTWTLWRASARNPITHGAEHAGNFAVHVRLPQIGLYKVSVRSGPYRTEVPLEARAARARPKILVVLPALTWQGENAADDVPFDGIPNTLQNGGPVALQRPFARGLPTGFADEEALLAFLDKSRLEYDLTTDLALIDGTSTLSGHAGVVLAGDERWLPQTILAGLRTYVAAGGRLLSLGIGSLRASVTVTSGQATNPTKPQGTDAFGARWGQLVSGNADLITTIRDGLGIFASTSGAFTGYRSFEPITPPAGARSVSEASTSTGGPSIVGYALGKGMVVEIGLVGFGASLAGNVDAQELVSRLWSVLGR
jgi:hypothetical protein